MHDFLNDIANYVLTCLTALMVYFFKQLYSRQTIEDAKETEARLRAEIKDLRIMMEKQQDTIYNQLATKSDLHDLKDDIKDLLDAIVNDVKGK